MNDDRSTNDIRVITVRLTVKLCFTARNGVKEICLHRYLTVISGTEQKITVLPGLHCIF